MGPWLKDERGDAELGMLVLGCVVALVILVAAALVFNWVISGLENGTD
jgi:hypothetical protein